MPETIAGIKIPDRRMAKDLTELIRDKEPDLLYHHSRRVYLFGALTGQREGLVYDPELLYVGAMFHDIGLTEQHRHSMLRFEVDGANAARDFLSPAISAPPPHAAASGRPRRGLEFAHSPRSSEPSTPSPTATPASSSAQTGQVPEART
jgi:HD domain